MRRIVWLVEAFVLGGIAALAAANLIRGPLEGPAMAAPSVAALDVVISEVAWMGTQAGDSDEWIELCNTTDQDISLIGWQLTSSDGTPTVGLTGTIPAHGYYLLERTDDDTVSDIPADQIYTGDLLLAGEVLTLTNGLVTIIDTANGANGGVWPAGSNNPDHTMERIDPASPDTDDNWCTNGGVVRNGLDSAGDPINGTPKAQNSCYQPPVKPAADLAIIKTGPLTTSTGALITYQIALSNTGTITATGVRVTDTLPIATTFITQTSPFTFTFSQVDGVLVWDVGDVLTGARHVITLALSITETAPGPITNLVAVTTTASETVTGNNEAAWSTLLLATHDPQDVVINEVAWAGHAGFSSDEWIELYNNTDDPITLNGWTLVSGDGSPTINLVGVIPPRGYYLLERDDDDTISDIPADQVYSGALNNTGESLALRDAVANLIDLANGAGGAWPAGEGWPEYRSMERRNPAAPEAGAGWCTNDGTVRNGLDAGGNTVNGTPKAQNSCYQLPTVHVADLSVAKSGPTVVNAGDVITYRISLSNTGGITATAAQVTDILPIATTFVTQASSFIFSRLDGTLVWDMGDVPTDAHHLITLTARVTEVASGSITNWVTATTGTSETVTTNNSDAWETAIEVPGEPRMLISALLYDGYKTGDLDEAVQLTNVGTGPADLSGWCLTDDSGATSGAAFPNGIGLLPQASLWCARNGVAFTEEFGFKPDYETDNTDPSVPELSGSWPGYANAGDECALLKDDAQLVDVLVYGDSISQVGWSGAALQPWAPTTAFAKEGQILFRKLDQRTGRLVTDTNTAADWGQDPNDHIDGRKVQYPGWDLVEFFQTAQMTATAGLEVAVAPDNAYEVIKRTIEGASASISIEGYTFGNAHLIDAVVGRAQAGVEVRVLLEGSKVTDQERWFCQRLHAAGGEAYFLQTDDDADIHARYRNQHAKFAIIDGRTLIVGSENFNYSGLPADDKSNGTWGRRGTVLVTDAPGVVARAQAIFDRDLDPTHNDIVRWDPSHSRYGLPIPGFTATYVYSDWVTYTVRFGQSLILTDTLFTFEVVQSPENSLRDVDSLLGLVQRAGANDIVLVEQLYESAHWGATARNPHTDPNPRLEAYIAAARRSAVVRILLNGSTDVGSIVDNVDTRDYVNGVARREGLNLRAGLGNPTGRGIHNKMILVWLEGAGGYVHVGSINGNEVSNKTNREVALQVKSDDAYSYLAGVFSFDWWAAHPIFLPLAMRNYGPPAPPVDYVVISEVYYAVGSPNLEWVELYNPTEHSVDLSGYKIGDAETPDRFEGMYEFPTGTTIRAQATLLIAFDGSQIAQADLELWDNSDVPDMIKLTTWGTGDWTLRNDGDQVMLLGPTNETVDVVVWGDETYPLMNPHPGVSVFTHSLERYPPYYDTDDCAFDFRDRYPPTPTTLPE